MRDKMSYAGGAVAFAGGLSLNEYAAIIGVLVAVATFFLNMWYKIQLLKIAQKKGLKIEAEE